MQENDKEQMPKINRQDWDAEKLADESVNQPSDEMMRQILRGDEADGNADDRDIAGSADSNETPQGREENKQNQNF
jgi:hypothetical protein